MVFLPFISAIIGIISIICPRKPRRISLRPCRQKTQCLRMFTLFRRHHCVRSNRKLMHTLADGCVRDGPGEVFPANAYFDVITQTPSQFSGGSAFRCSQRSI